MQSKFDYSKIGKQIQKARKNAGKTQKEVALACGCDPKHISAIETGRCNPSLELLFLLSEDLGVYVDFFFVGSPQTNVTYLVEVEYASRIQKMNSTTRNTLLKVMDDLLEMQEALS